mmetsp:Transcript_40984/g.39517  ORF Transcript_40984/g.39517 Transcript_40984/m.39517 type:complete len:195 (-) Transcript_40984:487-1071(-)
MKAAKEAPEEQASLSVPPQRPKTNTKRLEKRLASIDENRSFTSARLSIPKARDFLSRKMDKIKELEREGGTPKLEGRSLVQISTLQNNLFNHKISHSIYDTYDKRQRNQLNFKSQQNSPNFYQEFKKQTIRDIENKSNIRSRLLKSRQNNTMAPVPLSAPQSPEQKTFTSITVNNAKFIGRASTSFSASKRLSM